jgi:DNA-binding NarL/FixJ family response regulator
MIRVLLVDDQPLVRAGFGLILGAEDDIEVVGEADDGAGAVTLAKSLHPDLVLTDIRMSGVDGLTATRQIMAEQALSAMKVLILTTFELDEYVFEALPSGASGFLVKHTQPAELVRAVREVASGEALLSPSVTRRLIAEFTARPTRPELVPSTMTLLTEREREIVALCGAGPHEQRDRVGTDVESRDRAHRCQPRDGEIACSRSRAARCIRVSEWARTTVDLAPKWTPAMRESRLLRRARER